MLTYYNIMMTLLAGLSLAKARHFASKTCSNFLIPVSFCSIEKDEKYMKTQVCQG